MLSRLHDVSPFEEGFVFVSDCWSGERRKSYSELLRVLILAQNLLDPLFGLWGKSVKGITFDRPFVADRRRPQKPHLTQESGAEFAHQQMRSQGNTLAQRQSLVERLRYQSSCFFT